MVLLLHGLHGFGLRRWLSKNFPPVRANAWRMVLWRSPMPADPPRSAHRLHPCVNGAPPAASQVNQLIAHSGLSIGAQQESADGVIEDAVISHWTPPHQASRPPGKIRRGVHAKSWPVQPRPQRSLGGSAGRFRPWRMCPLLGQ